MRARKQHHVRNHDKLRGSRTWTSENPQQRQANQLNVVRLTAGRSNTANLDLFTALVRMIHRSSRRQQAMQEVLPRMHCDRVKCLLLLRTPSRIFRSEREEGVEHFPARRHFVPVTCSTTTANRAHVDDGSTVIDLSFPGRCEFPLQDKVHSGGCVHVKLHILRDGRRVWTEMFAEQYVFFGTAHVYRGTTHQRCFQNLLQSCQIFSSVVQE